jgi:isopentenyl diphosphate isomerase/L-lactate dehydrogenase-like FMN-dependent dehydrogenase
VLWGLAADGAAGVGNALDLFREELTTTMALSGQTSVRRLPRDLAFRVD